MANLAYSGISDKVNRVTTYIRRLWPKYDEDLDQ